MRLFAALLGSALFAIAACATTHHAQEKPHGQTPNAAPIPASNAATNAASPEQHPFLHGPRVTAVERDRAIVWARARTKGLAKLTVTRTGSAAPLTAAVAEAKEDGDLTLTWPVTGLLPGTRYLLTAAMVHDPADDPAAVPLHVTFEFRTPPDPASPSRMTLGLGSCDNDMNEPDNPVWSGVLADRPDAFALIGDTPYIDATDLSTQRRRYREFFSHGSLRWAMSAMPFYAVWDDHDFGADDADGRLSGKENARRAFIENNPQWSLGAGKDGIYSRFTLGAMDVFMLDCRWFAGTEPSFADPLKPTLLGRAQWEWLKKGLSSSTAPFKVLVSGMTWAEMIAVPKSDFWGAYPHERRAVFDFIAREKISGVVLAGGDLHHSRFMRYEPAQTGVDYPLFELIASPLGQVDWQGKDKDPAIVADFGENHMWATLTADSTETPPSLTARICTLERGERFRFSTTLDQLRPAAASRPAR